MVRILWRLALVACFVGLVVFSAALLLNLMSAVDRNAENVAVLDLLSGFHRNYLTEHGQSVDEYVKALRAFQQEHGFFRSLRTYLDFTEKERNAIKAVGMPPRKASHRGDEDGR